MSSRRFDDAARAIARLQRRVDLLERRASRQGHGHVLGYAETGSNQTGISTETDLTNLSVTVSVAASRYVRITGAGFLVWTDPTAIVDGRIKESTTQLGMWARSRREESTGGDNAEWFSNSIVITPSAGSHTYKLTLQVSAGTVDLEANGLQFAYILVEDIGAA